ncbi:MAG: hypothetical protein KF788_08705 [Piscinibacter sp.]|nr:hypothetical protein [Piscinibacter sp.]
MSAPCPGHCGRDCNADQGRHRCAACPGRQLVRLPITDLELAVGIVLLLVLLALIP